MRTLNSWTSALFVCALAAGCSTAPTSPTNSIMGSGLEADGLNSGVPLTSMATAKPSTKATNLNLKGIVSEIVDRDITVSGKVINVPETAKIVDALDAPLTFDDITVRKRVHVTGKTVSGVSTASIVRVLDYAVKGTVSGIDATTDICPVLTFTVDGVDIVTSASTEFARGECAKLVDGLTVEVRGILDLGILTASRVELPAMIPPKNPIKNVRVRGTVTAFDDATCPTKTFTVAGKEVRTDASTQFTGSGKCAAIAIGKTVDVTGVETTDTVTLDVYVKATRLNVSKK